MASLIVPARTLVAHLILAYVLTQGGYPLILLNAHNIRILLGAMVKLQVRTLYVAYPLNAAATNK